MSKGDIKVLHMIRLFLLVSKGGIKMIYYFQEDVRKEARSISVYFLFGVDRLVGLMQCGVMTDSVRYFPVQFYIFQSCHSHCAFIRTQFSLV